MKLYYKQVNNLIELFNFYELYSQPRVNPEIFLSNFVSNDISSHLIYKFKLLILNICTISLLCMTYSLKMSNCPTKKIWGAKISTTTKVYTNIKILLTLIEFQLLTKVTSLKLRVADFLKESWRLTTLLELLVICW